MDAEKVARGLGWFSLGLGLTEVLIPDRLAAYLGMKNRSGIILAYGFREIAAGIVVLAQRRPAPGVWARVGGDVLDLAALGTALSSRNPQRAQAGIAAGAVAGITVLDVICARRLSNGKRSGGTVDSAKHAPTER
ncbi:MAG: hypothetical protein AVDCRST_MAG73-2166 [uncultured Thermomicrobiales bacterium]|uniref:DUF4267 domain-containing protein n=1 Tax=uncultured Thermomicrobiales bacterium TaxID=1645740 RepID=A0A6J4UAT0_9BACT|nr:MAG: hypothetical protein AVDCRST_MAG73-2166 [uncultured Thermomicrobiales bacterium]